MHRAGNAAPESPPPSGLSSFRRRCSAVSSGATSGARSGHDTGALEEHSGSLAILRPALMPVLRACNACSAPFAPRHARHRLCPDCEAEADLRSPTTRTRPSSSTERERIRAQVLTDGAECALQLPGCQGLATVAHHIVDAAEDGPYELANLEPACEHCNSVLGGRTSSGLRHGSAERKGGASSAGGGRSAPLGPTRLA